VGEANWIAKLIVECGMAGVMAVGIYLLYRLADKWAPQFLAAQQAQTATMAQQASAMTSLAAAVERGQSDQREVLIAVKVLAERIDDQKAMLSEIEKNCRRGGCA
jgi:hypothetical protein